METEWMDALQCNAMQSKALVLCCSSNKFAICYPNEITVLLFLLPSDLVFSEQQTGDDTTTGLSSLGWICREVRSMLATSSSRLCGKSFSRESDLVNAYVCSTVPIKVRKVHHKRENFRGFFHSMGFVHFFGISQRRN